VVAVFSCKKNFTQSERTHQVINQYYFSMLN
jgi:hypothetical protein